jgi:iron-sulfur cluster assembly accessory protein
MAKDGNPNLALRITVESGGCHGFQYLMSLTTLPPLDAGGSTNANASGSEAEAKLDEDDTVFITDDDSGARIVMDGPSLELLKGSKVDYTMELIGSQFKIVDNPLATSSCGCGTSFDIKA